MNVKNCKLDNNQWSTRDIDSFMKEANCLETLRNKIYRLQCFRYDRNGGRVCAKKGRSKGDEDLGRVKRSWKKGNHSSCDRREGKNV